MHLKPQDVVVTLKLAAPEAREWTQARLAAEVFMSQSEVAKSIKRGLQAQLLVRDGRAAPPRPAVGALLEFLAHGIRYAFPPDRGALTRGIATAHAAPPLAAELAPSADPPPVWPWAEGNVRGESFSPLYPTVPAAAHRDPGLHELLALVDAIRGGRARERALAVRHLKRRLQKR